MARKLASLCAALVIGSMPAPAFGQQETLLQWTWDAPEICPTKSEVEAQVAELLGGPTAAASKVTAQVHAWRGEDALWHVELHTVTEGNVGERRVDGESCASIASAAALILAMAVDPEAVAAKAMEAEQPAWDPTDRPAPLPVFAEGGAPKLLSPPLPEVPRPAVPEASTPIGATVGLVAGADVGTLPGVAPWLGAVAGVSHGRTRLEARVAFLQEQETVLTEPSSAGGRFDLSAFGVSLCHGVLGAEARVSLCGGLEVGVMRARGFGVTDPGKADPIWLAFTPGVVGELPLTDGLSIRLEAAGGVPFRRPGFDLEPYGEVHRSSPVVGRISVGPQLHFP